MHILPAKIPDNTRLGRERRKHVRATLGKRAGIVRRHSLLIAYDFKMALTKRVFSLIWSE